MESVLGIGSYDVRHRELSARGTKALLIELPESSGLGTVAVHDVGLGVRLRT